MVILLAREADSLDWLFGTESEAEIGYAEFIKEIDIVLVGRKTYEHFFHGAKCLSY